MTQELFPDKAAVPTEGTPGAGFEPAIPAGLFSAGGIVRRQSLTARTFGLSRVIFFAVALAISGRAHADSILPAPAVSVRATSAPDDFDFVQGSGDLDADSESNGFLPEGGLFSALASARVTMQSSPGLLVTVSGDGLYQAGPPAASASIIYEVEAVAPNGVLMSLPVPIDASYLFLTDFDQESFAGSAFEVEGLIQFIDAATSPLVSICAAAGSPIVCSSSQAPSGFNFGEQKLVALPGVPMEVEMYGAISLLNSLGSGFNGSIDIDPTFTIDPAFLQENPGYSLVLSAGAGNSPPDTADAPEPATLAMLLAGFVALGLSTGFKLIVRHFRGHTEDRDATNC